MVGEGKSNDVSDHDLPIPPQSELTNELMLTFSGGLLKPLHNGIIKIMAAKHAVDESP